MLFARLLPPRKLRILGASLGICGYAIRNNLAKLRSYRQASQSRVSSHQFLFTTQSHTHASCDYDLLASRSDGQMARQPVRNPRRSDDLVMPFPRSSQPPQLPKFRYVSSYQLLRNAAPLAENVGSHIGRRHRVNSRLPLGTVLPAPSLMLTIECPVQCTS